MGVNTKMITVLPTLFTNKMWRKKQKNLTVGDMVLFVDQLNKIDLAHEIPDEIDISTYLELLHLYSSNVVWFAEQGYISSFSY